MSVACAARNFPGGGGSDELWAVGGGCAARFSSTIGEKTTLHGPFCCFVSMGLDGGVWVKSGGANPSEKITAQYWDEDIKAITKQTFVDLE